MSLWTYLSSENQPRRNEEHEGFFLIFLRVLHFFVVDFHFFSFALADWRHFVAICGDGRLLES